MTVDLALIPHLPCGVTTKPFAFSDRAFERDSPVLRVELGKVQLVEFDGFARLAGQLLYGLVYNLLKANAFVFFVHNPPYAGVLA